jgi:GntR family transcriptional regulator
MARRAGEFRYRQIADALRQRVVSGELAPGKLLASEADLSGAYEVSRVTVRKALESLRDEGLVDSRQGFGWFVAADPLHQSLGRLGTIEAQLAERGVEVRRRILAFGFVPAPSEVRRVLGTSTVLEVRRVNLADGQPFARVTVWAPDDLAGDISRTAIERSSFYENLPVEVGGATQTIAAAAADERDAALLEVPVGSPVLRCTRVTSDVSGRVVLMSEFVFPAHRTVFVVDLPRVEPSIAPTGLRLVSES